MSEKVEGKIGTASFVLGIISALFAYLPYATSWAILFNWTLLIFAPIGLTLGIVGAVKGQNRAIRGIVLCAVSIAAYFLVLSNPYIAHKAAETPAEIINFFLQR